MEKLFEELCNWLRGFEKLVIMGIGNPLRGDDFVGVEVAKRLKKLMSRECVVVYECETVPENFLGKVEEAKPSHVLLIDAAAIGLEAGGMKLADPKKVLGHTISTHAIPLRVLAEYIEETTRARVMLLAIQPLILGFGEGLSPVVEEAAEKAAQALVKAIEECWGK